MTKQIVVSPATLALGAGLVIALVAIAVMATAMLAGGGNGSVPAQSGSSPATPTTTPAVPSPPFTPAGAAATETAAPSTATPVTIAPTATPIVIVVQATAVQPTPTAAPTPPATATPRYASVDARPYWDKYLVARDTVDQAGVTTYEQALASPTWYARIEATYLALNAMQSFLLNELRYEDACKTALNIVGQRSRFFYPSLMDTVRAPIYPIGAPPTGQAGWNEAVQYWQPRFYDAVNAAYAACGY